MVTTRTQNILFVSLLVTLALGPNLVSSFTPLVGRSFPRNPVLVQGGAKSDVDTDRGVGDTQDVPEFIQKNVEDFERGLELGVIRTVAEFRDAINSQPVLSKEDRIKLIEQAQALIGDIYVHLPLKRAMHAIDPLQRLRLLRQHIQDTSVTEFHQELLEIFKELRDLHTNYVLPGPFGGHIAFLGVLIEQYYENGNGQRMYMVSKVARQVVTDSNLKEGVKVTHWNGMPIEAAIARNADKEAGCNLAARMARGLENLTLRFMRASLPPDEDWVTLTYEGDDGQSQETRLNWQVFDLGDNSDPDRADQVIMLKDMLGTPLRYQVGMDERAEHFRRTKKLLFNREAVEEEKRAASFRGEVPTKTEALSQANAIPTSRPDEISARIVQTDSGNFGYLRLWTFYMQDRNVLAFVNEVIRLVTQEMPADGLIIDVRGNGGGYVIASEVLLQLFTPKEISPEPTQFIATAASLDLAKAVQDFHPWLPSLKQAVSTGAAYSAGVPLSSKEVVNIFGQVYFGPVVLLTDAYCYSACDMFAAGFQDHEIGVVLGVDAATGAGGANVLTHGALVDDWQDGPLQPLPGGADMRVSLRRTLRVGKHQGQIVEDLGVKPDERHDMTTVDLLQGNLDLLNKAGAILAQGEARKLEVSFLKSGNALSVIVKTMGDINTVDVFVNDRPVSGSTAVEEGTTETIMIPIPGDKDTVRVDGWSNDVLVAKSKFSGPF